MKKKKIIVIISIVIIIATGLGVKKYLDNQKQRAEQSRTFLAYQKDGARRIKRTFSNVKEIIFESESEDAPGTMFIQARVIMRDRKVYYLSYLTPQNSYSNKLRGMIGGIDKEGHSYSEIISLPEGKTDTPVTVIYLDLYNDKKVEEILK
ncbi:MAG: hypothetical protein LBI13_08435 [Streptococcaceae bacterium]|jgi:hypothetical protein|nr:hypothetical protein [Streptococcaceae bacterium]